MLKARQTTSPIPSGRRSSRGEPDWRAHMNIEARWDSNGITYLISGSRMASSRSSGSNMAPRRTTRPPPTLQPARLALPGECSRTIPDPFTASNQGKADMM